jgi:squalene monooxygenase
MKLRDVARRSTGVDLIEANVMEMLRCDFDNKVIGVRAVRKDGAASEGGKKETFLADLVVVADGCFSNFRTSIMGSEAGHATTRSHFVGLVLEDAPLPLQEHGTAVLVKGSGYVLLYQISKHCTRMLVDVKQPVPSDLKVSLASLSLSLLIIPTSRTFSKRSFRTFPCPSAAPLKTPWAKTASVECPIRFCLRCNRAHPHCLRVSFFWGTRGTCGIL